MVRQPKEKPQIVSTEAIDLSSIADTLNSKFKDMLVKSADDQLMSDRMGFLSTGCKLLDYSLGGGILLGRITEIYGEEGSGKSTLAIHLMADCQKKGGICILIDSESNFDKDRAKRLGWDSKKCLIFEASYVEQGFQLIFDAIKEVKDKYGNNLPILVVWDTLHACPTEASYKGNTFSDGMMNKPRIIQEVMRKLVSFLPANNAAFVVLNQIISVPTQFGAKTDSTGGHAMRHYPTHRVKLRMAGQIKNTSNEVEGVMIEAKITKNKIDKPFRETTLPLYFYTGIDNMGAIFEFLAENKVITNSGGWYKIPDFDGELVFRKSDFPKLYEEKEGLSEFVDIKIKAFFPGVATEGATEAE